jgi:hypothetical protein
MMMAGTGARTVVSGNRMAMAAVGPSPGSTPTSVPSRAPSAAIMRFAGASAAPKPPASWLKTSTARGSGAQPASRRRLELAEYWIVNLVRPMAVGAGRNQRWVMGGALIIVRAFVKPASTLGS